MAKVTMPAGPTNLKKNMASGMSLPEATSKALGKSNPAPKTTRK